jgi:hypothetical protein
LKEEIMTPRALLTTIGATAIAFAITIGAAAGIARNEPAGTEPAKPMAVVGRVPHGAVHAAPGTNLAELLGTGAVNRAAASDRDCAIAL